MDEKPAVAKSGLSIGIGRVITGRSPGSTNQKVPQKSSKRQASKVANKDDDEKDGKGNPKLTEPKSKVAKTADSDTTCPGVVETAPVPEKPKRPSALRAPKKAVPEAPLAEANHGAEAPDSVEPKAAKRQRKAKTPGKDGNEEKGKEPQDEKENPKDEQGDEKEDGEKKKKAYFIPWVANFSCGQAMFASILTYFFDLDFKGLSNCPRLLVGIYIYIYIHL